MDQIFAIFSGFQMLMSRMKLRQKIRRRIVKARLNPIRIYCFHHVCETYNQDSMFESDWIDIASFKSEISLMKKHGYRFISLSEAHTHIKRDIVRLRKYAVITFDDGYSSLNENIPWLIEQKIPLTLFINGKYLDGISYRTNPNENYLTQKELFTINSPLIEIGNHGWEHNDLTKVSEEEIIESIEKNLKILKGHPRYIPFWAYTWGRHNRLTDDLLNKYNLIPVLMDGGDNYNDASIIHRKLLSNR